MFDHFAYRSDNMFCFPGEQSLSAHPVLFSSEKAIAIILVQIAFLYKKRVHQNMYFLKDLALFCFVGVCVCVYAF